MRGEVRFDAGSRALYATDSSNYRQVPIGVVVPEDARDVERAVAAARLHGAPMLGRGGGTSLAGQCCNTALVLDFSKRMHHVLEIDPRRRVARVQPGVVLDDLRGAAAVHGLTFGPDPATHPWGTLGGMIGNNSCGVHSVMSEFYGEGPTTAHNVAALEVLTYRGERVRVQALDDLAADRVIAGGGPAAELVRRLKRFQERYASLIRREFPAIPRCVSGYNLPALLPENGFDIARALVGSESTLALVLEAEVRLIPSLPHRSLVVLGFEDIVSAADHVPEVMAYRPVGLEGFDDRLARDLPRAGLDEGNLALLPRGAGWLLVEFGADTPEDARAQAHEFAADIERRLPAVSRAVFEEPEEQQRLWEVRESGLAATAHVAGEHPTWLGWEDAAVPPPRFGAYLRDMRALFDRHGHHADLYGHFGQGCLHLPHRLRSEDGGRHRPLPTLHGGGGRSGARLRRLAVRRTRRRPGPRRAAAADVQPRHAAGVPRVQVDPGSRLADESGQGDRRQPHRCRPALRHRLQPAHPGHLVRIPERRRQLRQRGDAVCRGREVPEAARRDDVPSLW